MNRTSSSDAPALPVDCRRCGLKYLLPGACASGFCCPQCGTVQQPLLARLRDNRNAAVLAFIALATLTTAVLMPFITMIQMGVERTYSLLGGIFELFRHGNWFLGGILLLFSVVFPFAKLITLLAATSSLVGLSRPARRKLHHLASITGKYSLLDLLVVAVMIVVVKFDGLLEISARPGTVLFGVAVLLSIMAGFCVNFRTAGGRQ